MLKVITASVTIILVGIMWVVAFQPDTPHLQRILFIAAPLVIIPACMLSVVRSYRISGRYLSIRRLLWTTTIDLSTLKSAVFDPKAMKGSIRTMGNGGLFSFTGRYRSRKLGPFTAYVNDFNNCVILSCAMKAYVVSPENPQLFVEVLESRIHR
jgi:hypothetical protein